MKIYGDLDWINGYLRMAHMEYDVPCDEVEKVKNMSDNELMLYLRDNGDIIIDDFRINDMPNPTNIEIDV